MNIHFPPEWSPHTATWLAWPYDTTSFPDRVPAVEREYVRIIGVLAESETVKLIVRPHQKREIIEKLAEGKVEMLNVEFYEADYADVWTRDWGPSFVTQNKKPAFVKWTYNAYGERFPELLKDDTVVDQIPAFEKFARTDAGFVMEGGAIEGNGAGTILTTEECLLNINRNAGMSREDIGGKFDQLLGTKKIIWLKKGLLNDHTDGHVDEIARFVAHDTILYAWTEEGANHEIMRENLEILKSATDANGRTFNLIPLPLPRFSYDWGEEAPASYCNFYIANKVVLVPQFGDKNDEQAKEILRIAYPNRTIIGIDSTDLIYGGGGMHCITQQEPIFG